MSTTKQTAEAANDNQPTKLAEQLTALMEYRNRPDTAPDPLRSSWSTDPSTVIVEQTVDEDEVVVDTFSEDLLLEIRPSIREIVRNFAGGTIERAAPEKDKEGNPKTKFGPIVSIGKLKFSDGEKHERAYKRGLDGDVVAYMRKMPRGAMLGTTEKVGGPHAGGPPATVTISNSNVTALVMGRGADGEPNNYRPFKPATGERRKGTSLTAEESRKLIDEAFANTPNPPPVKKCPPGMASGTAKFSDQFIGMKIGSTGKAGAPNWVDFFMAARDHEEWVESVGQVEERHVAVLEAAMSARSLKDVGLAAGQAPEYARRKGGKLILVAANDNLAQKIRKRVV